MTGSPTRPPLCCSGISAKASDLRDQVNLWLGTGLTLALAWSGYGAMSLAIGRVTGCVAGAILLLVFAPESLRLGFNATKARSLLRFGLPLCGANLLVFAVISVDQIVVGHVLGTVALGFYVLALNLAGWPITMFSQPVRTVGPAVFSRLQHDRAAMRNTFLSAAGLLCAAALPVCLLIGGSARPLVGFVYGARWLPAARPLMWLALLSAVQVFFLLGYDFIVVLGRSRFLLITQLIWLLTLVPALVLGARADGIYGASIAEFAVAGCGILPCYLVELSRAGIRLRALARQLLLPTSGAIVVGLTAGAAAKVAPGDFTALAASGVTMAAVVALLGYRMRTVLAQLRSSATEPAAAPAAVAVTTAPAPSVRRSAGQLTANPAPIREVADSGDETPGRFLSHDALPSRAAYAEQNEPPAAYRDILGCPNSRQDLRAPSPLYWKTVAALRWDPSGRPDDARNHQSLAGLDTPPARRPEVISAPHDGIAPHNGMATHNGIAPHDGLVLGGPHGNGYQVATTTADVLPDITREERP